MMIRFELVKFMGESKMTDAEKLDLILDKILDFEKTLKELKRQQMKDTAELKAMDGMILDEVEHVHELLNRKTDALEKRIG